MMDVVSKAIADSMASLEGIVRHRLDYVIRHSARPPESKIEEAFLAALISVDLAIPLFDIDDGASDGSLIGIIRKSRPWAVRVTCQADVCNYRADFLIEVVKGEDVLTSIVVECDGHDFHERTKEQARRDRSRDRAMTLAGYRVLRFTGSEIYANAASCVRDVWTAAFDAAEAALA